MKHIPPELEVAIVKTIRDAYIKGYEVGLETGRKQGNTRIVSDTVMVYVVILTGFVALLALIKVAI